ncbi:MAG: hypothetical protein ACXADS_04790 [Candidatus Thorarchaeota archaeon]|jgi:hypothetical protein
MRRIFMKTISEGLVAVITSDNVTNRHFFDVREEEEVFRFWSCVRCRRPIYDEVKGYHKGIEDSMDQKLEQWLERKDLCHRLETESWPLIIQSL